MCWLQAIVRCGVQDQRVCLWTWRGRTDYKRNSLPIYANKLLLQVYKSIQAILTQMITVLLLMVSTDLKSQMICCSRSWDRLLSRKVWVGVSLTASLKSSESSNKLLVVAPSRQQVLCRFVCPVNNCTDLSRYRRFNTLKNHHRVIYCPCSMLN